MDVFRSLRLPDSRITEAGMIGGTDGKPSVCRVLVESYPTETSLIRSVVWMPENWNGIFVGHGSGGIAGLLLDDYWSYAAQGYAVAQTDMGTSLVRSGERRTADAALWKDYTWRSTHIMTETAKALIECRYGRKPAYSYFVGASAGGLQGFSEAQRFPEDYDGIIAGVPANNALNLLMKDLWLYVHLHTPDGHSLFVKEDVKRTSLIAAEFFRARGDGEPGDTFISWPYTDENTVRDWLEYLHGRMPQFTPTQLEVLRTVYEGPKHAKTGEQLYCGLPIGAERNCRYFADLPEGGFQFPWVRMFFGEDFDERDFDFADDYDAIRIATGPDHTAVRDDLEAFRAHGAKFIFYSGTADPVCPWPDAAAYYNRVCARMGGYEEVSKWCRYFLLPGKAHANSGLGINELWADETRAEPLEALRAWRERGIAPDTLTGAHFDRTEDGAALRFVRQLPHYRGSALDPRQVPPSTDARFLADLCRA